MPGTTIKLGLMPPLTGLVGMYGPEIARAGLIACQEVNENGGVLGRPLELVIEDDGSLPESAVAAADKLVIRDQCTAIIGNLLSNSRIAVAYRVAEPRKIPYLNFSFYEGSIGSRYFFHFAALPNQQIERMIPYMREKYGPRMFFAGNNYEWPRGSIHAGKAALEDTGGVVVGEEYCPIGVSAEMIDNLLDQIAETAPDVFVPYFAGEDQLTLLTRFTERGLKKRMAVVMGHYDEVMASNLSPEVREGFYSSNTYFMTVDTASNRDFLARLSEYPEVTGVWPQGNGILTNFGEGTYVCVKAFAEAANRAGSLESEALVDALETIDIQAPQGMVQMNPSHHHSRVNTFLSRCGADGVFSIVEDFGTIDPILPERYRHQAIKQSATLEEDIRLQARILELVSEAVFIVRVEDKSVVYANAGAERMFSYSVGELLGLQITQFCQAPEGDSKTFFDDVFSTLVHKGEWQGEILKNGKDGSGGNCSMSVFVFTHPIHGEVWLFVATDITERKKADLALKESEQRYAFAVSGTNDGLWDWNVQTGEDYLSPRWKEILGYQDSELENDVEVFFNALHPDDFERVDNEVHAHFNEHVPFNTEYRLRCKDGSYVWIHAKGQAVWDDDGKPLRMAGFISDISERKRTEEALEESRQALRAVIDAVPAMVNAKDNGFRYVFMNLYQAELYGTTPDNAVGKTASELVGEEYGAHTEAIDTEVLSTGQAKANYEKNWVDLKGVSHTLLTTKVPLRGDSGGAVGIVTVSIDITKRKQAEEALKASEARLAGILDIEPEAVIAIGAKMNIRLFNQGAERIFGYGADEVLGRSLEMLMPERFRKGHRKHVEEFDRSSETYRLMDQRQEIAGLRKDGTEFPASASVSKLEIGGELINTVLLQDITERKQAHEALIAAKEEAEKASHTKSHFLAAVSHELRTPLNAILGMAQILKGQYFGPLGDEKYQEYANDIGSSGEYLLTLIDNLLDISTIEAGKQSLAKEKLSIGEVIAGSVKLVDLKALNCGINLMASVPENLPPLYADLRAIKQILLNLLSNAIKFTPKGGKITVSAKASKTNTTIKVADTGRGISVENLPGLTDMFVRAEKDPYVAEKGWGLGLSITKSLVDLHNGKLDIKSKVGKGTTVTVTLPNGAP